MKSGKGVRSELLWKAIQRYIFREEKRQHKLRRTKFFGKACAITGVVKSKYRERRKECKKERKREINKASTKGGGSFHEIMSDWIIAVVLHQHT
jgi:hypothetical protein